MAQLKSSVLRFGASLLSSRPADTSKARRPTDLFPATDPAVDGDDCLHDCDSCTAHLPRSWKIEEDDALYGLVNGWQTHLVVATGKSDWVRSVEDEKGSLMQAIDAAGIKPSNGKMMLSASNMPTPHDAADGTTALLLPSYELLTNVQHADVPALIAHISAAQTNTSPLQPATEPPAPPAALPFTSTPIPHDYLILLCSHRTRDARCGQSAPLLRRELERHLRPRGLFRDPGDLRPGGVGIFFINHLGGHKYSANVMVYRSARAVGADASPAGTANGTGGGGGVGGGADGKSAGESKQAVQCIWLARVRPEDCENLVRYTVLQGKVVKPERQLRGGFDRARGLVSW